MNTNKQADQDKNELGRGRYWLPISVFAVAIGYYLYYEHRAHIPGDYIFAIFFLVICGGMHFFMHGGHGHNHGPERDDHSAHDHDSVNPSGNNQDDNVSNMDYHGDEQ